MVLMRAHVEREVTVEAGLECVTGRARSVLLVLGEAEEKEAVWEMVLLRPTVEGWERRRVDLVRRIMRRRR